MAASTLVRRLLRPTIRGTLLAAAAAALALGATAPASAATHGTSRALTDRDSTVRAGFSSDEGQVTSVEADWTEPRLNCATTPNSRSNVVVALQGPKHRDAIMIGAFANCVGGAAKYGSWVKWPGAARQPAKAEVSAGLHMDASAYLSGGGANLQMNNSSWSLGGSYDPFPSGGVEVLAGSAHQGPPMALSAFGTIYFSNATVNAAPMGTGPTVDWRLVDGSGNVEAVTSGLHPDGDFAVNWRGP